jgi:nuclear pore complex protein Nup50
LSFQQNEASKSPFAAFGGFKATSVNSASPFSFLTKVNKPSDTSNSSVSKNVKTDSPDVAYDSKSAEYCSSLKGLNQCVSQWIKSHVDSNPFCILTPIFRDYERYLTKIEEKEAKQRPGEKADETQRRVKSPATGVIMSEWCVYLCAVIYMPETGIA